MMARGSAAEAAFHEAMLAEGKQRFVGHTHDLFQFWSHAGFTALT